MALLRKLFYRKPPDGLLEICERVYVFDCCFTIDSLEEQNYKGYVGSIIGQLREHYPDASILAFNFREGDHSQIANALTEYDMTIMEYPRQYEGCPMLPMEVIHHFLRSSESWLQLGLQNLLLMHCERGGWPVLAFMLAALLIYRKHYTGELKTLDMVYRQAPRELLQLLSPLNPIPSQLRYLQYVSRRNVATEWPPLDRALTMDCVIIRMIPNFDGEGGCRPIFRIYGQDPLLFSDRAPKVLFSTPKKSRAVRHYKQAECELVKIDINCHIQGDVVLECISLHDDMEREEMMFRVMFNTAFIRSNILMLNRDEIDILWDAKDLFPKDFRAEVLFSEMDNAISIAPLDYSCFEEKDGLPVEAFAKVHEMFSSVDWLVPKGDAATEVLQHLNVPNTVIEAYSRAEKSPANRSPAASEVKSVASSGIDLTSNSILPKLSPKADVGRMQDEPHYSPSEFGRGVSTNKALIPPGYLSPPSSTSPAIAKIDHISPKQQSKSNALEESDTAKDAFPLREADTSSSKTYLSTPPNQPSKDADVGLGKLPLGDKPVLCPLTAPLEDKVGIKGGVVSTPTMEENTTAKPGISSTSTENPMSHDKVIKDGPPKSEPSLLITSSIDDVLGAAKAANPPPPPSPPPPTHSSTMLDVGESSEFESTSSPAKSTLNAIQATSGGPISRCLSLPKTEGTVSAHLSSSKTDVTPETAPDGPASPHLSSPKIEVTPKTAPDEAPSPKTEVTTKISPGGPPSTHLSSSKTDVTPKTAPGGPPSTHLSLSKIDVDPKPAPGGAPSLHPSSLKTEVTPKTASGGPVSPHISSPKTDVTPKIAPGGPASPHIYSPKTDVTPKTALDESASPHFSSPKMHVTPKTAPSEPPSPHLPSPKKDVTPKIAPGGQPFPHVSSLKADVTPKTALGGPPSPNCSSSKRDFTPRTEPSEPSSPHLPSPKKDVTLKILPPPPPSPLNIYATPNKENPASTCGPTPSAPSPPPPSLPTSPLKENSGCGVGPPSPRPSPLSPHLRHSSTNKAPPPPTTGPANENLFVRGKLPLSEPPPPPPPISPKKKHSTSGVVPPPPPPSTPPSIDNSVTKPAPCPPPPPPPPVPAKERSSEGGPPLPPPLPPFQQGAGSTNAGTLPPPPPPPAPATPAVPSAPPISGSRGNTLPGAPSPPPPSAPPPGAKGKSLLSRNATSKNNQKKLKPLHWLKLTRAVTGSLWAEAQKSGEASKAPEIDISELESLFSAAVPNPGQGGSGRKCGSRASMGNKSEKVQLIEHRRAYNCEIMLSKVKIPLHDMLSSVLALEDSALDVDQVDNLIKFCPTKDEMEVLKGYKGERDKLGKCEQFFLELMQVPRIEYKLRVFSFKIQFCSQVSDLRNSLNVVNSAADQIRGSAKLKRIMQTILSLGNALNQGTARGSAIGFRLDSLLKLTETRARNNKMTLMHYLCKVLSDKLPELLDFWQELSSLEPASKIQLKFLAEEMQAINKGLEKVVQELSMSESDGPVSDQFRKALKEFLGFSEGEVRSLASLYAGVGRNVDSLILYFGEDPSRCPFEQVISTLLNFVKMFKKAHEENCKQLEFERKKAEKEASEKMKMNASDTTGHLLQSPISSVK